ncbi:paired amphipathic helix protein Sin3-like 6 [Juglans microcarpa x Juglans regia]|uniref:paired amphipathic helix protein Sin3-like 6 n=1 Tax=Juglans microcarpa x Juglans regia TaxID=2249226 RepID=UPI001B7ECB54|nr:paired amphipathic helix protein Sin3-like 6 [Juglans microcarpa x Juglans regia]
MMAESLSLSPDHQKQKYPDDEEIYENFLGIAKDFQYKRCSHKQEDAIEFLRLVKDTFKDRQPETYDDHFLEALQLDSCRSSEKRCTHDHDKVLQLKDAYEFLNSVKVAFKDNPAIYHRFFLLIKHWRLKRIDFFALRSAVEDLFEGQPELLVGFNTFLPTGFEISTLAVSKIKEKARNLLYRIKMRFANDQNQHFVSFAHSVNECGNGEKSFIQFLRELTVIFSSNEDLLLELVQGICNESFLS